MCDSIPLMTRYKILTNQQIAIASIWLSHTPTHKTQPFSSEFGQSVAKEYLKFFEFQGQSLDDSLRQFLSSFSLTGESQERERVMIHFSERYQECNPHAYESVDTVHGVTVALLLLNTDLFSDVSVCIDRHTSVTCHVGVGKGAWCLLGWERGCDVCCTVM